MSFEFPDAININFPVNAKDMQKLLEINNLPKIYTPDIRLVIETLGLEVKTKGISFELDEFQFTLIFYFSKLMERLSVERFKTRIPGKMGHKFSMKGIAISVLKRLSLEGLIEIHEGKISEELSEEVFTKIAEETINSVINSALES